MTTPESSPATGSPAETVALTRLFDDGGSEIRRVARKLPAVLAPPRPAAPSAPVGRSEPCPCGSGKKYKQCCGGFGAR